MPINITHEVAPSVSGQIAYQGGRGLFEQKEDEFNLRQQALDDQNARFNTQLKYRQQLALLKDRQQGEQRDYQSYERGLDRQASQYDRQSSQQFRLMQMGLSNQAQTEAAGIADDRRIAGEGRAETRGISKENRRFKREMQQQDFQKIMMDAKAINDAGLTPSQREQAVGQWLDRNGSKPGVNGQFPFTQASPGFAVQESWDGARQSLQGMLGYSDEDNPGAYTDGLEKILYRMDGDELVSTIPEEELPGVLLGIKDRHEDNRLTEIKEQNNKLKITLADTAVREAELRAGNEKEQKEQEKIRSALEARKQKMSDDRRKELRKWSTAIKKKDNSGNPVRYDSTEVDAIMERYDEASGAPGSSHENPLPVTRTSEISKLKPGTWVEIPDGTIVPVPERN